MAEIFWLSNLSFLALERKPQKFSFSSPEHFLIFFEPVDCEPTVNLERHVHNSYLHLCRAMFTGTQSWLPLSVLFCVASPKSALIYALRMLVFAAFQDVLVGGSSSVAAAIDWTLAELLRHPHYLQQAQEELDSVVGRDRLVEEFDLPNLQFLNSVLKESLRLHPPLPLSIPHYSVEECIVAGYTIPANTTAYVNIWAIGRDPSMWKNPTEFHPERFMDSKVNFYGQDFQFLPFSSGRRGCPGIHVALANLKLMLANLLHCFTWEPAPCVKGQEIEMGERDGIVCSRLEPLLVSLQPRVSESLMLRS